MHVTYFSYWSLLDPLCQSQCLAYIKELTKAGYSFSLFTLEQEKYALDRVQTKKMKAELKQLGIKWYPLEYHKSMRLFTSGFYIFRGVLIGSYTTLKNKSKFVHSRSSVPAGIALLVSKICRTEFLYDADSTLSEEYLDIGYWKRDSLAFRTTSYVERKSRELADKIIVLTDQLKEDFVNKLDVRSDISVIPCCVDTDLFFFDEAARKKKRAEIGVNDETVFIYIGKVGTWYAVEEMFEFFKVFQEKSPTSKFLIISQEDPQIFSEMADRHRISKDSLIIRSAYYTEISEWLSAADFSLAFIHSLESKKGSSPIKVGEYLAVGLPVVITENIGDYSKLIKKNKIGGVIDLRSKDYEKVAETVSEILVEDKATLRERCRRTVIEHASLTEVGFRRYAEIYRKLSE